MHIRHWPPSATATRRQNPSGLPATTSEDLVATLLAAGGHVLSQQPHGALVQIRRHLVFVPATRWATDLTVADALRAAGLTVERFLELRPTGT